MANEWLSLRLDCLGAVVVLLAAILAIVNRNTISPALAALTLRCRLLGRLQGSANMGKGAGGLLAASPAIASGSAGDPALGADAEVAE